MTNYAGAESAIDVAAGFLSFSHGSKIAEYCLDDLVHHFRGYDWGYNGPGVITRALQKLCGVIGVGF
jgi:lactosylceramide 4-alpha-galactosyltransferase